MSKYWKEWFFFFSLMTSIAVTTIILAEFNILVAGAYMFFMLLSTGVAYEYTYT
jgi:hypothetical protein